jgi:acetyl-CoA synthetase
MFWQPDADTIRNANITRFMSSVGYSKVPDFYRWTVEHYANFWSRTIEALDIRFKRMPSAICDLEQSVETPKWLPNARMNIGDSCFLAPPTQTAIIYQKHHELCRISYAELDRLSNQVANGLITQGLRPRDSIGIIMPMDYFAIAIYLGIVKMGGVVVSIADSFSSQEIATRLQIANTKAVLTQYTTHWSNKIFSLYEKLCNANPPRMIVINHDKAPLARSQDMLWDTFLSPASQYQSHASYPMDAINILFSSGTTATPKAIPWNHTTPIKVASDAYFHHNIKPGDVLAWPTNLGWMMGPWLLFAGLINQATLALYTDNPSEKSFGEFVEKAGVTCLGVVPTLVAHWRQSQCMASCNWQAIKVFSSTGECSNPEDMSYLMRLGGHKPIIEYCGGTEIGGAYLSSTVVQNNYPALFSTPTMGMHIMIIDEKGHPANHGEVAIIPPSIGLSNTLMNQDHHQVYFANMPHGPDDVPLRRHGDAIQRLPNGYFSILGRVDDAMKIGGIKVSAIEIERLLVGLPHIIETAAIAVASKPGVSQLFIYAVTDTALDQEETKHNMQQQINQHLNPLFKIQKVIFVPSLPKTASNKIMRRLLRDQTKNI